LQTALVVW